MLIIGIETSGTHGSIALFRDGEFLEQRASQQEGRRHAQSMVLELREVLRARNLTPRDVDAIAVSRGPGSFTGLRVGVVCAKTFAYATGCQFVSVDTFQAVAANCPSDVNQVWVVEDAQRGELFAGLYDRQSDESWRQVAPIGIVAGEQWLADRSTSEVVTGRGLGRHDLSGVKAHCLIEELIVSPTAAIIAALGAKRLRERVSPETPEIDFDLWKAVPFYLRPSAAEEKRDNLAKQVLP